MIPATASHVVPVALAGRSYEIVIGRDVLASAGGRIAALAPGARVAVVTDETVAGLHLTRLMERLAAGGLAGQAIVLKPGEATKNWTDLGRVVDGLLADRLERGDLVIAFGGGVIGDLTGFAAAIVRRGMRYVQIPTTLLAQVDSSVGGKTAINHPLGKNMIGAFYQPKLVIADIDTLNTLPLEELRAGIAEVIKYGLIRDPAFVDWLEENMSRLLARDPEALIEAVHRSCAHKAAIVAADEREAGERALLNLGHTFGHAIETAMGYGAWLHGEAVAAGTMMAAELSRALGWLSIRELARIEVLLASAGLPVRGPAFPVERYIDLMRHDKKVEDGKLRLVLLETIGRAVVSDQASEAQIGAAIRARI